MLMNRASAAARPAAAGHAGLRRCVLAAFAALCLAGSARAEDRRLDYPYAWQAVDIQELKVASGWVDSTQISHQRCDVAVIGGGLGGMAATLALCEEGWTVVLAEETDWLGGQATAQGVSALDENRWVERGGATRSYQRFRDAIREHYLADAVLPEGEVAGAFNPGNCWVSRLSFEPAVGHATCLELLAPYREAGLLTVKLRNKVVGARRLEGRVERLLLADLDTGQAVELAPAFVLDATELGDLLPLCGVDYVTGVEGRRRTGERDAPRDDEDPGCVQSFTYPFVLASPGPDCALPEAPSRYASFARSQPFTSQIVQATPLGEQELQVFLFEPTPTWPGSLWEYRRLIDARQFNPARFSADLSLMNWIGNDYHEGTIIDVSPEEMLRQLSAAKDLSLSFYHWLKTQMGRPDGGAGYPEICLEPEAMGTVDGLSKFPYVRESRRIIAMQTLRQQDVEAPERGLRLRGRFFANAVAIGCYDIDLHAGPCDKTTRQIPTLPFQIPLGALIPVGTENLIPAAKNIGVTHITNGCIRVHNVQWGIGEAAGRLAGYCLDRSLIPEEVQLDPTAVLALQTRLVAGGAPIYWYGNLSPQHADFVRAQMRPFWLAASAQCASSELVGINQNFNWPAIH